MRQTPDKIEKPSGAQWPARMAFFFWGLVITGLFTFQGFRVLSGIGIAGLVLLAFLQPGLGYKFRNLLRQKPMVALAGIFLLQGLSVLYTSPENYPLFRQGIVLKLPFLLLPLAAGLLPPLSSRFLYRLYYLFFLLVLGAVAYSLVTYSLHFAEINQTYHRAGVLPTLVNHVRFSLMVALAIVIGFRLWQKKFYWRFSAERYIVLAGTGVLFGFLHLLAVRSGLIAFYGVLFGGTVYLVVARRALKLGLTLAALLVLVPVVSYFTLTTFREKLNYTRYDLGLVRQEKNANSYSLAGRYYSYLAATPVIRENPWLGVGLGGWQPALSKSYARYFPGIQPKAYLIPHNQFLYYALLFGGLGLAVFVFLFYYPAFVKWRRADPLLAVHYLILTLSFLTEATLETQVGLIYSLVFIVLPLSASRGAGGKPVSQPE